MGFSTWLIVERTLLVWFKICLLLFFFSYIYIYAMLFEYGEVIYVAFDWLYVNVALGWLYVNVAFDVVFLFPSMVFTPLLKKYVIHNKYNDRLRSWEQKGFFFSFSRINLFYFTRRFSIDLRLMKSPIFALALPEFLPHFWCSLPQGISLIPPVLHFDQPNLGPQLSISPR